MRLTFRAHLLVAAFALCVGTSHVHAQDSANSRKLQVGQQTFSNCAPCHGLDGAGGEHAPNIATNASIQNMPDTALLGVIRNGIPNRGMPGFAKVLNHAQLEAVLAYLRVLQGAGRTTSLKGNPVSGRQIFFGRGACGECHMVNGAGGFLAADLSGYAKGRAESKIRGAILSPNTDLDTRRGTITVTTTAGQTYRGIIRNEDNFSLQMQTTDGAFHFFDKCELAKITHEPNSLMPADYGSKLSKTDLDDLISFLAQSAANVASKSTNEEDE